MTQLVPRRKVCALVPSEREQLCRPHTMSYTGKTPVTGVLRCTMCGARAEDLYREAVDYIETELQPRYERIMRRIRDVAVARFDAAFVTIPGGSFEGQCFHLAHNWAHVQHFTPEQRDACDFVNRMRRRDDRVVRLFSQMQKAIVHGWVEGTYTVRPRRSS